MNKPRWERVRSCFDAAAAETFFGSLEQEVLSGHEFENTRQVQAVVLDWCHGFYNHKRRHNTINVMSPSNYENTTTLPTGKPHKETLHDSPGEPRPTSSSRANRPLIVYAANTFAAIAKTQSTATGSRDPSGAMRS